MRDEIYELKTTSFNLAAARIYLLIEWHGGGRQLSSVLLRVNLLTARED